MKFPDRRTKPRIAVDFPVTLEQVTEMGEVNKFVAYTVDLSDTGCSLFLDLPFIRGDKINLSLQLSSPYSLIDIKGWLVWRQDLGRELPSPYKYRYGFKFLFESPETALLLNNYIQNMSKVRSYIDRRETERRRHLIQAKRRFDRRTKEFYFEKTVYLSETNSFGNVYFSRYLDWTGMALETFFYEMIPLLKELKKEGMDLTTIKLTMDYKHQAQLFDELLVIVKINRVRNKFLEVYFKLVNGINNGLIATSKQILVFTDSNKKITPVPERIREDLLSLV